MAAVAPLPAPHFNWPSSGPCVTVPRSSEPQSHQSQGSTAQTESVMEQSHQSTSLPTSASSGVAQASHSTQPMPPCHSDSSSAHRETAKIGMFLTSHNQLLHLNEKTPRGKIWEAALQNSIQFVGGKPITSATDQLYQPINRPIPAGQGRGVLISAMRPSTSIPKELGQVQDDEGCATSTQKNSRVKASCSNSLDSTSRCLPTSSANPVSVPQGILPFQSTIATTWVRPQRVGPGFLNVGNTCFLNATLQALVHTPALAIGLLDRNEHSPNSCPLTEHKKFCALCRMHRLVNMCLATQGCSSKSIEPWPITKCLGKFAPNLRFGQQEDAHEFLRLLVESMQDGALGVKPEKAKNKQKESSFIHRMFGGKLRSRVVCEHCHTSSDTFDNFLDLSLDISQVTSVPAALKSYRKYDRLYGANQYKCEKCRCLRDAKKVLSVFSAPPILTLHLKRFNFRGRKINKPVSFEDQLDLRPAMSEDAPSTRYKLYAVVCHQGQSNKSGHYYAHVKASNGQWYVADDSSVETIPNSRSVFTNDHAYMLFYARERGDMLAAAITNNPCASKSVDHNKDSLAHKRKLIPCDDSVTSVATASSSKSTSPEDSNDNLRKKKKTGGHPKHGQKLIGPIQPSCQTEVPLGHVHLTDKEADELHRLIDECDEATAQPVNTSSDSNTGEIHDNPFVLPAPHPPPADSDLRTRIFGRDHGRNRRAKSRRRRHINMADLMSGGKANKVAAMQPRIIRG